jgi:hypothetical protein
MADKVTKICMDIYRKLEESRVLNVKERLQIPKNLEICYLYNLQWKYVKKYISIQASIFLFVSSVLNNEQIHYETQVNLEMIFIQTISVIISTYLY